MIDYFETKSQAITRAMVVKAYREVKSNKGSGGIDNMSWQDLDKDLLSHLYKLWNRLSSGSYFPQPVKEVEIAKKDGGVRKLGIPTLLDRIAQQVAKHHLEKIVEPLFNESSFGYRPAKSCQDAVNKTLSNIMYHDWVIERLIKWIRWEKGYYKKRAVKWLKNLYKEKPNLFYHWKIAIP